MTETFSLLVLLLHFASTFYMVGLVWFVQRVHYPLFASVGSQHFLAYPHEHVSSTSTVVTNWIRTSAWSLRGVLVLWIVSHAWAGAST